MPNAKKKYKYFTKALTCPDGSRKYIRGKTQKELDEKVRKAMLELDQGVNINDSTTFGQLAQMWVDLYKRPRNKPQSMKNVLNIVNGHLMPRLGHLHVRSIKPVHISAVMLDASHLSRVTQASMIQFLRAIFSVGVDNGLISRSPVPSTLKPTSPPPPEKEALTPTECAELLACTRRRRPWLHTFTQLCLYTGLRAGEACGLMWDCVDFDAGVIQVRRQVVKQKGGAVLTEELKTASSRRDIPAPPELMDYLRRLKATTSSVLVVPSSRGGLLQPSNAAQALHNLDLGFEVHPHLLRHTYATRLVESGVMDVKEVQYLLGHTTPALTLRVYAHYDRKSRSAVTASKVAGVAFTG